jgi:DNA repair protein RecN (Recombination protein N)
MLKSIDIENFAIIDKLTLVLEPGLNIFTGETGAGKSIIIEALGFVLGARADAGLIREKENKTMVSAVFNSIALPNKLKDKYGISAPDFTLKREMDVKSKSRAWLNGAPVLISDLSALGDELVDFHGQHEHQALFRPSSHLALLDAFAQLNGEVKRLGDVYKQKEDIENKIAALKMSEEEKEKLLSLYKYQLEEIEKTDLKVGEDAALEASLPKLKNAEKLKSGAAEIYNLLSGMDNSASELISKAGKLLRNMSQTDEGLSSPAGEIEKVLSIVDDIAQTLSNYGQNIDADAASLDIMLSRQETLRRLKQKYGPALEDVFATKEKFIQDINNLRTNENRLSQLQAELETVNANLQKMAGKLSQERSKAADKLGKLLLKEVSPLGFGSVRFAVDIQKTERIGSFGQDSVEFLFSSNAGQSLRPLRNIASGGEVSRLMLGLKTVLAGGTPIMVFDEIDAGISGNTGKLVGQKLKQVAFGRQVLCVTHLAQTAVYGDANFTVIKRIERNTTKVVIKELKGIDKIQEIGRMIGSNSNDSAGFKHATELLKEAEELSRRKYG